MPDLSDVFATLNRLKEQGVIQNFAIGGAMAFLFYTEPVRTYDLDVFVFLPPQDSAIFSMQPLYRNLQDAGYTFDAEHVMICDTPVQFLPVYNDLVEEAVNHAVIHEYQGVQVPVVGPEYLVALAFQTRGRHRLARAESLLDENVVDPEKLSAIMARHGVSRNTES